MGWQFSLEHANIVSYLTSTTSSGPRVSRKDLDSFLGAMSQQEVYAGADKGLWTGAFLSQDCNWVERINRLAADARSRLSIKDDLVQPEELETILYQLRSEFSNYKLFALVLDDDRDRGLSVETKIHAMRLASDAKGDALVLFPSTGIGELRVLDPFPGFSLAVQNTGQWPGVLFWSSLGTATFIRGGELPAFVNEMLEALKASGNRVEQTLRSVRNIEPPKRILHLSDLHFGSRYARSNLSFLKAELSSIARDVDCTVITGDLLDGPKDDFFEVFNSFCLDIQLMTKKLPVIVPGNHDQRVAGNIRETDRQLRKMSLSPVVVDDELQLIFACFNSSESGTFARGAITEDQFRLVGEKIQSFISAQPGRKSYLRIAVTHHHPLSFETDPASWFQRALNTVGLSDEIFLEMENASALREWCAQWDIPLILHGHKHVRRWHENLPNGQRLPMYAIGCGTSLGAEGRPLGYAIVRWDPHGRRWSVEFFESQNGCPFVRCGLFLSLPRP